MTLRRIGRSCIYCGNPAGNREHVFEKWLIELVKRDPRGLRMPITAQVQNTEGGRYLSTGARTLEVVTKHVDASCNGGWMNDLGQAAREALTSMVQGQPRALSPDTQAAVAAWAAKTLVTARYVHSPVVHAEPDWLHWIHAQKRPMLHWNVWLARYDGPQPIFYYGDDLRLGLPSGQLVTSHGLGSTLVLGHLVVQMFGLDGTQGFAGGWVPPPAQIWPVAPREVHWPPALTLDDHALRVFAQRFLGNHPVVHPEP